MRALGLDGVDGGLLPARGHQAEARPLRRGRQQVARAQHEHRQVVQHLHACIVMRVPMLVGVCMCMHTVQIGLSGGGSGGLPSLYSRMSCEVGG